MKRIIIVRHAKSVPYGYHDDFNRDLKKPRGYNDATKISTELKNYNVFPDLMISSPAVRAFKTARLFAETFDYPENKIKKIDELYEGLSTHEFLRIVNDLPDHINVVYFFGHNPTLYYLIKGLSKSFNDDIPTSSSVVIDFNTDNWNDISTGTGKFAFQLTPRMYK